MAARTGKFVSFFNSLLSPSPPSGFGAQSTDLTWSRPGPGLTQAIVSGPGVIARYTSGVDVTR
jgi:hypothetical protein